MRGPARGGYDLNVKTRVLYLIGTLDVGGAERQLVELASHIDRRFDPAVCCLFAGGPLTTVLEQAGVRVLSARIRSVRGPQRLARLNALWRLPLDAFRTWRLIRRYRPAVLHAVLFHSYVIGAFIGRLAGVPVIVAGRRSLAHFKRDRPVLRRIEAVANRLTDAIVANSEAVRQDTIASEGLTADRVSVIYNGLEPDRYVVAPSPALRVALGIGDGPVVIVVANLISYKGHPYFLRAWVRIRERFPEAVALLCGDGPARQALEAEAAALDVAASVRFLGSRQDVPDLLAIADVLVHPSLEEGFCNALIEAMAAGRPVVATDVGGNAEAVVPGETGWIVPARDADAMAEATIAVLVQPDRGRAMGAAGRRRAVASFDRRHMIAQYEALYDRLLADRERTI